MEQVVSGLKALGFFNVVEVALGADMVAWREAQELAEKKFLTSSCCPAFVDYIRKSFPDMAQHISHNLSPMGEIAKYRKKSLDQIIRYIGYLEQIQAPVEYFEMVRDLQKKVVDLSVKPKDLKQICFRLSTEL